MANKYLGNFIIEDDGTNFFISNRLTGGIVYSSTSATNDWMIHVSGAGIANVTIDGTVVFSVNTLTDKIIFNLGFTGRIQEGKGSDVASATTMTLGSGGNYFTITGTTTIDAINPTGWQQGSVITLYFTGNPNVRHGRGGTDELRLDGSADFTTTADSTLTLRKDTGVWREIGRMTA